MKIQELVALDANQFVFQMIKFANNTHYMYECQINDLIEYTKHYYASQVSDKLLIEKFKQAMKILLR